LNKTKIQNIHTNQKKYNVISQKFNILSCYGPHGTMMFYDNTMFLSQKISTTNSNAKFITTSFKKNTREALYIIAIYKPQKMKIIYFNSILETIFNDIPKNNPTI
jgi:hypothetical protein